MSAAKRSSVATTRVRGRVTGDGDLRVEGNVEGDITLARRSHDRGGRPRDVEHRRAGRDRPRRAPGRRPRARRVRIGRRRGSAATSAASSVAIEEGAEFVGTPRRGFRAAGRARRYGRRRRDSRRSTAGAEDSMASTVIGAGITIEGEVTSDEDVVVQGTLRGKLVAEGRRSPSSTAASSRPTSRRARSRSPAPSPATSLERPRRPPERREGRRQREGHAHHDRGRRPVQGQRRHGRVTMAAMAARPSSAAARSFAAASRGAGDLEIAGPRRGRRRVHGERHRRDRRPRRRATSRRGASSSAAP